MSNSMMQCGARNEEIIQHLENTDLLMKTCLCRQNRRMECWPPDRSAYGSERILGIRAEINHFNCKKLLHQTHYFYPACQRCRCAVARRAV